jgi:hypothetical protein
MNTTWRVNCKIASVLKHHAIKDYWGHGGEATCTRWLCVIESLSHLERSFQYPLDSGLNTSCDFMNCLYNYRSQLLYFTKFFIENILCPIWFVPFENLLIMPLFPPHYITIIQYCVNWHISMHRIFTVIVSIQQSHGSNISPFQGQPTFPFSLLYVWSTTLPCPACSVALHRVLLVVFFLIGEGC